MFPVARGLQGRKDVPGKRRANWKTCHEFYLPLEISIVHLEFDPRPRLGRIINREFLKYLRGEIRRKRLVLWSLKYQILHDANVFSHRVSVSPKIKMVSLPHLLYSPHLAPADFYLFLEDDNATQRPPF